MNEIIINVGIIDDDSTKRTQLISALSKGVSDASEDVISQYEDYILNPIELNIRENIEDVLYELIEKKINVLLADYQLSSYEPVDYNGVDLADLTDNKYLNFPIFLLTSYEADLYRHETFDAYKVFDYERYMTEPKERIELNKKIIEQYEKRKRDIANKQRELLHLQETNDGSPKTNDRIFELDDYLERSLDGENAISKLEKKRLFDDKFEEMMNLLHQVLKEE